jgi:hypothetical protein
MTKINFIHICENAFLSKESGNLNLIGIFDGINSKNFPALHPLFFLVANIVLEENKEHDVSITVKNTEDSSNIFETPVFKVFGDKAQIIYKFINYNFKSAGNYEFYINIDQKQLEPTIIKLKKI